MLCFTEYALRFTLYALRDAIRYPALCLPYRAQSRGLVVAFVANAWPAVAALHTPSLRPYSVLSCPVLSCPARGCDRRRRGRGGCVARLLLLLLSTLVRTGSQVTDAGMRPPSLGE
jgi:hypothetical protein